MLEFILIIAILAISGLLFGKADTKREILNQVGLDYSPSKYESVKEKEFKKYCIKAMYNAIEKYDCRGTDEISFLRDLAGTLKTGVYEEGNNLAYLMVKKHYIRHAYNVVEKRIREILSEDATPLIRECVFSNKSDLKRYIEILWNKYQYPWPEDWQQQDGGI